MENSLYSKVVQEYLSYNADKRNLMKERDMINAKIGLLDDVLTDLNDILSRHGKHVYEYFFENEENKYAEMDEYQLINTLSAYSDARKGDFSELTKAAAERIMSLTDTIERLKEANENAGE